MQPIPTNPKDLIMTALLMLHIVDVKKTESIDGTEKASIDYLRFF
jgi:hypothetical protein